MIEYKFKDIFDYDFYFRCGVDSFIAICWNNKMFFLFSRWCFFHMLMI